MNIIESLTEAVYAQGNAVLTLNDEAEDARQLMLDASYESDAADRRLDEAEEVLFDLEDQLDLLLNPESE